MQPDSVVVENIILVNASSLPIKAKGLETNIRFASDDLEFLPRRIFGCKKKYDAQQSFYELTPK